MSSTAADHRHFGLKPFIGFQILISRTFEKVSWYNLLKETLGVCSRAFEKLSFWCAPVNSCSVTSMTVVHFLHQTDIGLALRKHKAIYSLSRFIFLPPIRSLSISLYPLMYLHLCYANRSLVSSASVVQTLLVPFLSRASIYSFECPPPPLRSSPPPHCSFPRLSLSLSLFLFLSHLHPPPPPHPPPLSPSLCLCFPLLDCYAVDLTAMINDLKASGKQTERQTAPFLILDVNCSHRAHEDFWNIGSTRSPRRERDETSQKFHQISANNSRHLTDRPASTDRCCKIPINYSLVLSLHLLNNSIINNCNCRAFWDIPCVW